MKLLVLFLLLISLSLALKCEQPRHRCPNGQICTGHGCLELCNGVPCPSGFGCKDNQCVKKKKKIFG